MDSLNQQISASHGRNLKLHDHINPQFGKVLSTIGFDKVYVRGEGVSLWDDKGNEYYDFLAGYGVYAFGRNHPKIKEILKNFIDTDSANLVQMEAPLLSGMLAERLIGLFGHGVRSQVFFTNSGTEAVEGAIKFARAATGRQRCVCLEHAFHGLSTGSLSVNGNTEFQDGFGELLPSVMVPMGDLVALEEALKSGQCAAFVFEPIQGKGVFIPLQGYFREALALCKKYGTVTIADEVQTGLGRTGDWLACEHEGVEPDIITISKSLSGGMVPVGAILYTREIYDKVFSRMDRCVVHSSTFGQNNLAMVCGLASLDIIEQENLLQNARHKGQLLLEKLLKLKEKHEWVHDVRGRGLMIGIEFGRPVSFKKRLAWDTVHKVDRGLFAELIVMPLLAKHRLVTQVSGHHQDILKIIPPLTITETHVNYFVAALDNVLSECTHVTGPVFSMAKNLVKHVVS